MSAAPARRAGDGTAVLVRCGPHVLAISTAWVERLVLAGEVDEEPRAAGEAVTRAWFDGAPRASWDLGLLLGLGETSAAHVLLRVPFEGGEVPIALRTGACLAVQALPPAWPLRPEVLASRRGALPAAFDATGLAGKVDLLVGWVLDPAALLDPGELARSVALAQLEPGAERGA